MFKVSKMWLVSAAALSAIVGFSCTPKKLENNAKQKTITTKSISDGQTFFESVFIDELGGTNARRFCAYYAKNKILRDPVTNEEDLPVIDQLIAASDSENGGILVPIFPPDTVDHPPFSATDFSRALDKLQENIGGPGFGGFVKRISAQLSLAGMAVQAATNEVKTVYSVSSRIKTGELNQEKTAIQENVALVSTTIALQGNDISRARDAMYREFKQVNNLSRVFDTEGRKLKPDKEGQTLAAIVFAISAIHRDATLVDRNCKNEKQLAEFFKDLKEKTDVF